MTPPTLLVGAVDPTTLVYVTVLVGLCTWLVVFVIVGKAVRGYRQRGSRPMLLLAVGLLLLTVVPNLYSGGLELYGPLGADDVSAQTKLLAHIGEQLLRLFGAVSILASLYVRR